MVYDTGKAASLEPWFPAHLQRDIYFSLLHIDPSQSKEKKTPAIPESVLKAALLRRATEDIRRVLALRSQKQALSMLLQRGSVGDDLWQRFLRAEKEMEEEVKDVVSEVRLRLFPGLEPCVVSCSKLTITA
jgi:translocation protein SEC66